MPDPDHYISCFPDVWQQQHFCILARMNEEGHSTPTGPNLYINMTNSNNIAMRNVTILKDGISSFMSGGILWGNHTSAFMNNVRLSIEFESLEDAQLLQKADVSIKLDDITVNEWLNTNGFSNRMDINGNVFTLTADGGFVENFVFPPNTVKGLTVQVTPRQGQVIDREYKFDLVQYNEGEIIGGENYVVEPAGQRISLGVDMALASEEDGYNIYPNPTGNYFKILSNLNATSLLDVKVYNLMGQEVLSLASVEQGQDIDVNEFVSGIYVIHITDTESKVTHSQKLTIKK